MLVGPSRDSQDSQRPSGGSPHGARQVPPGGHSSIPRRRPQSWSHSRPHHCKCKYTLSSQQISVSGRKQFVWWLLTYIMDIAEYSCSAARDYFLPGESKTFYPRLRFYFSLRRMGTDKIVVMSVTKFNRNSYNWSLRWVCPMSKTFWFCLVPEGFCLRKMAILWQSFSPLT